MIWCAGETNTQPIESYLTMLKKILNGYDSLNPLTPQEKQAVYDVLCAAAMNTVVYIDDDTLDVFQRNLKALMFLSKNKEMFFNLL